MVDFSIGFDEKSDIPKYLKEFEENQKKTPLFEIKIYKEKDSAFIHIKPLLFPLYYISPFIWIFGYVLSGSISWQLLIIGGIPCVTLPFYYRFWYISMMKIGKWKRGYKGKILVL